MGFFLEGTGAAEYSVVVTPVHEGSALAPVAFALDSYRIGRADVAGLSPETPYVYDLFSAGELVGGGAFVTPPATRASIVRIALGSDIHWEWKPYLAFDRIRELAPHALFMMGDQIYSDYRAPAGTVPPEEAAYRDLYAIYWDDPSLARCWANVPTLLMWDDHDILNDYDGAEPARFAAAEAAFRAYQGVRNPPPYRERAHYYATSIGPIDVFVLDTRSYRDPNDDPDGPEKTMLGTQQRADLEAFLLASDAPVKLVISPTPFHAHVTTNTDAWAYGFASERDALFAFLRDEGITGVVLASGDQHFPAVVRHDLGSGYAVIEVQCTPTAAHPRSVPNASDDPSVLYLGPGDAGFGLLDVDATVSPPAARFAWVGADGNEAFTLAIPLG
jgi:alkaline phosphatase D